MAQPKLRADGITESMMHIACAIAVGIVVYLIAGFVAQAAVMASRYWSG